MLFLFDDTAYDGTDVFQDHIFLTPTPRLTTVHPTKLSMIAKMIDSAQNYWLLLSPCRVFSR